MSFSLWWFIWKEHNNRIFDNKELSALQLAKHIQDEILLHKLVLLEPNT
jgi:hypothetical protein